MKSRGSSGSILIRHKRLVAASAKSGKGGDFYALERGKSRNKLACCCKAIVDWERDPHTVKFSRHHAAILVPCHGRIAVSALPSASAAQLTSYCCCRLSH